jgi:hypothetical protein
MKMVIRSNSTDQNSLFLAAVNISKTLDIIISSTSSVLFLGITCYSSTDYVDVNLLDTTSEFHIPTVLTIFQT